MQFFRIFTILFCQFFFFGLSADKSNLSPSGENASISDLAKEEEREMAAEDDEVDDDEEDDDEEE